MKLLLTPILAPSQDLARSFGLRPSGSLCSALLADLVVPVRRETGNAVDHCIQALNSPSFILRSSSGISTSRLNVVLAASRTGDLGFLRRRHGRGTEVAHFSAAVGDPAGETVAIEGQKGERKEREGRQNSWQAFVGGREQGVKGMSAAHRWCWPIEQIGLASQNFSPPRRIDHGLGSQLLPASSSAGGKASPKGQGWAHEPSEARVARS